MDAKTTIGRTLRLLRESAGFSQEQLAERAGITYQYVSTVENGKENFTIGVLEALAGGLGTNLPAVVEAAYQDSRPAALLKPKFFIDDAPLPPGLTVAALEVVLNETHKVIQLLNTTLVKVSGRPLSKYIQANNFSGIVSNILCNSFSRFTAYKHNHDQRYPDLAYKNASGKLLGGLEVKSTIRPGKGGESHNGHSGWHLVACFALEKESGEVRFIHAMFANLIGHGKPGADWKYVGSNVNKETGSQRTETYTTTPAGTAKLRHGTVYLDTDAIDVSRWRTDGASTAPKYSPFKKNR